MDEYRDMAENLRDAGCCDAFIRDFLAQWNGRHPEAGITLLRRQRRDLLEELHEDERKLECLDYLIHRLRAEEKP